MKLTPYTEPPPGTTIVVTPGQPGQPGGSASMAMLDRRAASPAARIRKDRHGEEAIEKLCPLEAYLAVNLSGHIVQLAVHAGRGDRGLANHPNAERALHEKLTKGFVLVGQCPSLYPLSQYVRFAPLRAKGTRGAIAIPVPKRKPEPCTVAADGASPITDRTPCACVVDLLEARTVANGREMRKVEDRVEAPARELRAKEHAAIEAAARRGAELAGESSPRKAPKR